MRKQILILFLSALVSACSAHKIEVQQGNIVDLEVFEQIEVGMTRQQVRFLLGNPVIIDSFHPDRWDYVYFVTPAGSKPTPKRLSLHFKDEVLVRIDDQYHSENQS